MPITGSLILVPTIWSLLCHIVSYGLQLDKSCLVMSCQIKQARLCRLCHCHTNLIIKRAGCQVLDVLWGFGWGGGSDCWGSLSCNLPVFSLENGLFYMFYSLLKHTISTHFRQFEMQKRSEPHLNCFDDLLARKKQPFISGIIFSFFWIFCHGSSVLLGVLAGKFESWILFPDFFLASFSFFAHVSHFKWGRRFLWRGKSISGFFLDFSPMTHQFRWGRFLWRGKPVSHCLTSFGLCSRDQQFNISQISFGTLAK